MSDQDYKTAPWAERITHYKVTVLHAHTALANYKVYSLGFRRTWNAVPSTSPKRAHASQACQPWGCFLPLAAAQATRATPAGSSRKALTKMGLVCGASSCV